MQPLTEQQQQSLVSYSEQRDFALLRLSNAQKDLEDTLKKNADLTESNSQLVSEIAANKQLAVDTKVEAAVVIESTKNEIAQVQKELENIKAKKEAAQASLDESLKTVLIITDSVSVALDSVKATKDELITLKQQVNNNVDSIVNGAVAVQQAVDTVHSTMDQFTGEYADKVVTNERRSDELDARSARLDVREQALNLTYGEVVAQMDKKGMKLSDLNKAA